MKILKNKTAYFRSIATGAIMLLGSAAANAGIVSSSSIEDFDDGYAQGWALTGLWHVTGNNPNGSAGALGYVKNETIGTTLNGNFNTGGANSGTATSNLFTCGSIGCTLSFDSLDGPETSLWDELDVSILHSGGPNLILNNNGGSAFNDNTYRNSFFDLTTIVGIGNTFQVQFSFATLDGILNNFPGPRVDNFVVTTTNSVPEPGTIAIMGLGLAGLGYARRKKAA